MKSKIKGFVFGMIIGLTFAATLVLASSGLITKQLSYDNIKIELDGKEIVPKDANGNYVEPFTIDGTTYLPVRAVSGALGLNVDWDDKTNTVLLSTQPPKPAVPDVSDEQAVKAVKDYIDANRDVVLEMNKSDQYKLQLEAKGTSVVYKYFYSDVDNLSNEELDEFASAFKSQFDSLNDVMDATLELMKKEEPAVSSIIYEFYTTSGKLIYSCEFK